MLVSKPRWLAPSLAIACLTVAETASGTSASSTAATGSDLAASRGASSEAAEAISARAQQFRIDRRFIGERWGRELSGLRGGCERRAHPFPRPANDGRERAAAFAGGGVGASHLLYTDGRRL